jgi:hypothetical protein
MTPAGGEETRSDLSTVDGQDRFTRVNPNAEVKAIGEEVRATLVVREVKHRVN